jgi:hypothetical protein
MTSMQSHRVAFCLVNPLAGRIAFKISRDVDRVMCAKMWSREWGANIRSRIIEEIRGRLRVEARKHRSSL